MFRFSMFRFSLRLSARSITFSRIDDIGERSTYRLCFAPIHHAVCGRFSIVGACGFNGRHFSTFHTVPTSALADGITLVNTFADYRRALHIPQFGALDLTLSRA